MSLAFDLSDTIYQEPVNDGASKFTLPDVAFEPPLRLVVNPSPRLLVTVLYAYESFDARDSKEILPILAEHYNFTPPVLSEREKADWLYLIWHRAAVCIEGACILGTIQPMVHGRIIIDGHSLDWKNLVPFISTQPLQNPFQMIGEIVTTPNREAVGTIIGVDANKSNQLLLIPTVTSHYRKYKITDPTAGKPQPRSCQTVRNADSGRFIPLAPPDP